MPTNVEIVRRVFEALMGGVPETALRYLDDEIEYDVSVRPDGRVWHGPEGARQAVTEWVEAWDDWSLEVDRYLDLGDERVAVLWRERGTARESGVAITQEGIAVVTLRDGMVVSIVSSVDRDRVLSDLGVEQ